MFLAAAPFAEAGPAPAADQASAMINSDLARCEACRYEHLTPPKSHGPPGPGSPVPQLVPFLAGAVTPILLPGDGADGAQS